MKRFFCSALAGMMLSAALALPASAAQSNVDVDALRFTEPPTIDGIISEEEWGAVTVTVRANEAATKEDDAVNRYNTYIEYDDPNIFENMYYDLWLRYDDDYFYVAARVHDVDGHAASNPNAGIWNNDVVQLRIDPQGPNSAMLKKVENYDYKTTAYDYTRCNYSDEKNRAWQSGSKLIDACFALIHGTRPQAWDTEAVVPMETSVFDATTVKLGDGEEDFSCETSYEIAIPWAQIGDKVMGEGYRAQTGDVLGMTLMVRNSCGASYDAILEWGSGLNVNRAKEARKTSGGSNAVTLSEETFTPAAPYAVAGNETEDTTEAPADTTAPGPTDANTVADTQSGASDSSSGKPTDYSNVSGGVSIGVIIGIAAAAIAVAVVAVLAAVIVKRKKK